MIYSARHVNTLNALLFYVFVSVFCNSDYSFQHINLYRILFQIILGNPGLQRGWEGKGETGSGKKGEGRGGEVKGKGEALGSFSIQIISRSKSKHH